MRPHSTLCCDACHKSSVLGFSTLAAFREAHKEPAGLFLPDRKTYGICMGFGFGFGFGFGVGFGFGFGAGFGVGFGFGDGLGVGVGDGLGLGDGLGIGCGCECNVTEACAPLVGNGPMRTPLRALPAEAGSVLIANAPRARATNALIVMVRFISGLHG